MTAIRVVITGANGLLGSRLCRRLADQGHEVTGLSRGSTRLGSFPDNFRYRSCELTDPDQVQGALREAAPELILHPASMTDVEACERDPEGAFAANVNATAALAQGARAVRAHLVYVSSDYVFDGDHGPYTETDLPNPRGIYATTKLMGELAARTFVPDCAIARTSVVYGWPEAGRPNFGTWLVKALESKQQVRLFEDQIVSPSLADNVAAMVAELGLRRLSGIWNICGRTTLDRMALGREVCRAFNFDPSLLIPVRMRDANLKSPRPLLGGLKTEKACQQLTEKPLPLGEALLRFHAAYSQSSFTEQSSSRRKP